MAAARNSLSAASLQSGVPVTTRSSRYSRIVVLSCNRVVMDSTLAIETSESNDVVVFCYLFEISTTRQMMVRGRLPPGQRFHACDGRQVMGKGNTQQTPSDGR